MTGRVGGGSSSPRRARKRSHVTPTRPLTADQLAARHWHTRQTPDKKPLSAEQLRRAGWRVVLRCKFIYESDDINIVVHCRNPDCNPRTHWQIRVYDDAYNLTKIKNVICDGMDAVRIAHQEIIRYESNS